jgi:ABC-type transport system substrate-binding protein
MQIFWGCYEYDYIDPSNMLTSLWRSVGPQGSPRHNYLNPEFDALLDAAAVEQDAEKRLDLFSQAEKILVEEVGAIFIQHGLIFQLWHPYVQGIPADKNGNVVWRGLDITFYQAYLRNDVTEYRKTPTR